MGMEIVVRSSGISVIFVREGQSEVRKQPTARDKQFRRLELQLIFTSSERRIEARMVRRLDIQNPDETLGDSQKLSEVDHRADK